MNSDQQNIQLMDPLIQNHQQIPEFQEDQEMNSSRMSLTQTNSMAQLDLRWPINSQLVTQNSSHKLELNFKTEIASLLIKSMLLLLTSVLMFNLNSKDLNIFVEAGASPTIRSTEWRSSETKAQEANSRSPFGWNPKPNDNWNSNLNSSDSQDSREIQEKSHKPSTAPRSIGTANVRWKRNSASSLVDSSEASDEKHLSASSLYEEQLTSPSHSSEMATEPRAGESPAYSSHQWRDSSNSASKLHIVKLLSTGAVRNGTQNVTLDCMFKFDRKLDAKLTIKWFFNDELEPIYQWIPELNKRVYSDRYEKYLDKSYQVDEDVDFMLQAYKSLTSSDSDLTKATAPESSANSFDRIDKLDLADGSRHLLANRLSKLASLGGRHSRQLLESLRLTLAMDQPQWSRFRALRLIRPTTELSGRFTCSVSSLDGEDLHSTQLVVYEPAKNFSFTVSRAPGNSQQYKLTCEAFDAFPRPSLSLFRYRAGPVSMMDLRSRSSVGRPNLAATKLKQEPLVGVQTQVTVSAASRTAQVTPESSIKMIGVEESLGNVANDIVAPSVELEPHETGVARYDLSAWALVDESSLSNNLVSQFECQLAIEGTNYEQRQTLSLQRGWHINPAAETHSGYTLVVGLMAALASLLCLLLALVKFLMVQRKIRSRSAVADLTPPIGRLDRSSFSSSHR